jgi:hypothetical protein
MTQNDRFKEIYVTRLRGTYDRASAEGCLARQKRRQVGRADGGYAGASRAAGPVREVASRTAGQVWDWRELVTDSATWLELAAGGMDLLGAAVGSLYIGSRYRERSRQPRTATF